MEYTLIWNVIENENLAALDLSMRLKKNLYAHHIAASTYIKYKALNFPHANPSFIVFIFSVFSPIL